MLINKYSDEFNRSSKFFAAMLCVLFSSFSNPACAVLIEGKITGVFDMDEPIIVKPKTPFFDVAVKGQSFSADFWYEFDENNFPPNVASNSFREYDFDFSAMSVVVHVGDESFSPNDPNDFQLTNFRNVISIFRHEHYSHFALKNSNGYNAANPRFEERWVDISFAHDAMTHFSGLDLIQNFSIASSDGAFLGMLEVLIHGTREGDRFPGDFYDYGAYVYGTIDSIEIRTRYSSVSEPGSFALIMLALVGLGWRYCRQ